MKFSHQIKLDNFKGKTMKTRARKSHNNRTGYIYGVTLLIVFLFLISNILLQVKSNTPDYQKLQNYQNARKAINNARGYFHNQQYAGKFIKTQGIRTLKEGKNEVNIWWEHCREKNETRTYYKSTVKNVHTIVLEHDSYKGTEKITLTRHLKSPKTQDVLNSTKIQVECESELSKRLNICETNFEYLKLISEKTIKELYSISKGATDPDEAKTGQPEIQNAYKTKVNKERERWNKEINKAVSNTVRNLKKFTS